MTFFSKKSIVFSKIVKNKHTSLIINPTFLSISVLYNFPGGQYEENKCKGKRDYADCHANGATCVSNFFDDYLDDPLSQQQQCRDDSSNAGK